MTNTGWSDYVFQPLVPPAASEQGQRVHQGAPPLPDMPSGAEVKERGAVQAAGEIEELTLYMIQQEIEPGTPRADRAAGEGRGRRRQTGGKQMRQRT